MEMSTPFEPLTQAFPRQHERDHMVQEQLLARGVREPSVIRAVRMIPRHEFVPAEAAAEAYGDYPLPIGYGQTISQPYIVGYMTEALHPQPHERVLEIGTGSGYQAAVLSLLSATVLTLEIVAELAERSSRTFRKLGLVNITVRAEDGARGCQKETIHGSKPEARFDMIIVTAAPKSIPYPLLDQLAPGGRLIVPVGTTVQRLILFHNTPRGITRDDLLPVTFVPLTGKAYPPPPTTPAPWD